MLLAPTFQFSIVNFKRLYVVGFLLNLSEKGLSGKLKKLAFTWLNLKAIWTNHLGDMGKEVRHMQAKIVSAGFSKWLVLTY